LFSALRTHAQLFEASRLLKTADGGIKPFNQFAQDIASINKNYNENYLQAEYQFATASALMAQKWSDVEENQDRYNLQYRTAGDEKVRASHQALDMITLPASDTFWNTYYPPNGWRCRCDAVEVLKDKYDVSDSELAIKAGEKATTQLDKNGKNRLEIFRFNPGKQKVIFPPKHPYRKLQGADGVVKTYDKKLLSNQRKEIRLWAKDNLVGQTVKHPKIDKPIQFTTTGIKEALNQPHKNIFDKNEAVRDIKQLIHNSKFVSKGIDKDGGKKEFYYLKTTIKNEDSFIVIKFESGNTSFYSIVDKIKG
jgi:SPP1 gp7 family putative phage head morphogenesis protein